LNFKLRGLDNGTHYTLIARSEYIQQFESDEYSVALVDFLWNKEVGIDPDSSLSNANDATVYALSAIQKNNPNLFLEAYEQISHRKPKPDSDWIYNDILLFALTVGVCKFKLDEKWLIEILDLRITQTDDEKKLIAQTLIDALKKNFDSINNYPPLMLVIKYLLDLPPGDILYINSVYEELIQKSFPYSKAVFLNLVSIKALDIILMSKGVIDWERQKAMTEFIIRYEQRIHQIATIPWGLLVIVIVGLSAWFLYFYLTTTPQQADIISRVLTILPFFGIGSLIPLVSAFKFRKKLIKFFEKPFHYFYGYKLDHYRDTL
jgi:hypothetical protein